MELTTFWKAVLGNILWQIWTLAMITNVVLIVRLVLYQELFILLYFIIGGLLQNYVSKSQQFIKLIQWFNIMKMFDQSEIIQMEPTKPDNSLFCFHPHGIYCYGMLMNAYTKGTFFENMIPTGSRVPLMLPIAGLLLRLYGVQGVNASNFQKLFKEHQNVGILPGGYEEATLTTKSENRVYIKERKGFIKYALKAGVTVYPVFTFGENQLFYTFDRLLKFRLWLNKYKLLGAIFWSRFLTIPEPHTSLITVCGRGIQLPQIEQPTNEDIQKYHAIYIQGLKELYDTYAPKYAPNIPLVMY